MDSWVEQREQLGELARRIDSAVRLTTKDGWLWRGIGALLPILTIGGISRAEFLEDYATTIGPLQGYPRHWPADAVEQLLIHEARHTRQARWFGLGFHPWLGLPLMGLVYLLLPLPLGLSYFRYRLELDADVAEWRHGLRAGAPPEQIRTRAARFAAIVSSGAYGWAWPRRWALRGFERAAEREIESARREVEASSPKPEA